MNLTEGKKRAGRRRGMWCVFADEQERRGGGRYLFADEQEGKGGEAV